MLNIGSKDFTTLTRCLNLTTSDQDGEVLAAARAANRILARHKLTWESVWQTIEVQIAAGSFDTGPEIDEVLSELLARAKPGSFRILLVSIQQQWREKGHLSDRQRKVVLDAYERQSPNLKRKPPGNGK